MVSKVQTFEEWADESREHFMFAGKNTYQLMRDAWQAAHKNAAVILESQCSYTEWNEQGRYAAEQIRDAAK